MNKLLIKKNEFIQILLGVTLLALGINWFTSPLGLVTGGISGITIIVKALSVKYLGFEIPLWITNFALNVPLFVVSIKQRGFEFAKKSLWSVVLLSCALWYTDFLPNIFEVNGDLLLGGVFGAIFIGLGVGIVLRTGATTGGTDMFAAIIRFINPKFPIAKVMLGIDSLIILAGLMVFGSNKAMYAIIAVYITSKIITNVLEGVNYAKAVFIMSDKNDIIAQEIMQKIPRGVTGIKANGKYTGNDKEMLFVVVSQKEITKLRNLIRNVDEQAFVTIADVREVLGEGFIEDYTATL
ncbi:YitT family protein [Cellulosilyticum ruminicola]|uniref:YitT family protein n=1 Tax=Cellulosilyticum ruminicola TaxID=425254 RepID=UPI0006D26814|nr:YitT family protein [Cellulosilyticum ruminicola]